MTDQPSGPSAILEGRRLPFRKALETLVGVQRTTILRLLDEPRTAGRLAEALIMTPGAATHHFRSLESAGLIIRERSGQHVIIRRTSRGTRLLGLYEEA